MLFYCVCVAGLGRTAKGPTRDIWLFGTSFGGVLLKKACLVLHGEPDFAEVASKATTHIFFATPHRGSRMVGPPSSLAVGAAMPDTK